MVADEKINSVNNRTEASIDLTLYSISAVQKACYKFTAQCSIKLEMADNNRVLVVFTFPPSLTQNFKEKILNEFNNEILDQHLREIVAKETESVRNLILAHAFSKTSLIEPG